MKKVMFLLSFVIVSLSILAQSSSEDWVIEIGGPLTDQANAMCIDDRQNVYITGFFQGEISVGKKKYKANGDTDIFLAKINNEGDIEWFNQAGSNITRANVATEMGNSIILDQAGDVIVCGIFSEYATFGDTNIMSHGSDDIFLAKYSNDGNLIWVKGLGSRGCNIAHCLAFDGSVIYLTGESSGSFFNSNENSHGPLAFIASFDNDGNLNWYQEHFASPMIANSSLSLDENYIYWGSSVTIMSEHEQFMDLNNSHYFIINKVNKIGSIISSSTFKINADEDHFRLLTFEDSILVCDNHSGEMRNISSLLDNEDFISDEMFSSNTLVPELYLEERNITSFYGEDSIKEMVRLIKPVLSPNGQFLKYLVSDNSITINEDQEVALRFNGNSHTYIPYISDFKIVAATNKDDQIIYLLANYSGNILVNESEYLFSKYRNIFLMKSSLKNLDSGSFLGNGNYQSDVIQVNPDPLNKGIFNLECSTQMIKVKSVIVKDETDQVIYSNFDGNIPAFIDISSIPGGIYFLLIEFENNTTINKLILAK